VGFKNYFYTKDYIFLHQGLHILAGFYFQVDNCLDSWNIDINGDSHGHKPPLFPYILVPVPSPDLGCKQLLLLSSGLGGQGYGV